MGRQDQGRITKWETFSNSPPYFQTVSGYVSGGFDASEDQIRPESVDEFADLPGAGDPRLEKAHGIRFATVDPLNEPNTNYWGTTLGADGKPPAAGRKARTPARPCSRR